MDGGRRISNTRTDWQQEHCSNTSGTVGAGNWSEKVEKSENGRSKIAAAMFYSIVFRVCDFLYVPTCAFQPKQMATAIEATHLERFSKDGRSSNERSQNSGHLALSVDKMPLQSRLRTFRPRTQVNRPRKSFVRL